MAQKFIAPPELVPESYMTWKKEMRFWEIATPTQKSKRAPTVFLGLKGKAREAVLEMDPEALNTDDGMLLLYEKLDSLFLVDKNQAALEAYGKFEKYLRPSDVSMFDFQIEFDRMVQQLKAYEIQLPEAVLAYRALKSANLNENHEKLIMATVKEITLKEMMSQIRKVMGVRSDVSSSSGIMRVKVEAPDVNFNEAVCDAEDAHEENALFNSSYYGSQRRSRGRSYRGARFRGNNRGRFGYPKYGAKKQNPPGPDGKPSRCAICGSTLHWARDCQHVNKDQSDRDEENVYEAHIVLMSHSPPNDSTLLGQTIGATVLDSGCSRSVCGLTWFNCFLETLPENEKKKLLKKESKATFRFGNGGDLKSMFKIQLPCILGGKKVLIAADVVESDIPLLLSKDAMKKSSTIIDFENDSVLMFGKKMDLCCTDSGHYYMPLSSPEMGNDKSIILFTRKINDKSLAEKRKMCVKLHRQFSHPSKEKMNGLVNSAGIEDLEFLKVLEETADKCEICIKYKRSPPKPVVGFALATRFNEALSMDIKEICGIKVLHMIDNFTRYSAAVVLKSKESSEILKAVFRYWVAYFGPPAKILTDNGREFNNELFRDMAANLNITVLSTAAQSPWSNGLNERHNGILNEMVLKLIEDLNCSLELALTWSLSSKNALGNINGYSPNQLVFGYNPNIPTALNNKPPALENMSSSEVVANNLNAMHAARRAFVQAESSEKLMRALRHKVRPIIGQQFENGDRVYFKRNESNIWKGPGTVIGAENKQVLVKHGGTFVRVHPCRLLKYSSSVNDVGIESSMKDNLQSNVHSNELPSTTENPTEDLCIEDYSLDQSNDFEDPVQNERTTVSEVVTSSPEEHNVSETRKAGRPLKKKSFKEPVIVLPKSGQNIVCKIKSDEEPVWRNVSVIGRAGKSTGRNRYFMNVSIEGDEPAWIDFENSIMEWKDQPSLKNGDCEAIPEEVGQSSNEELSFFASVDDVEYSEAKLRELSSWQENNVYTIVPDSGQNRISTKWVCTKKEMKDDIIIKARLVAKGFQDEGSEFVRSDSPTCAKESLRIVLSIICSYGWQMNSMDIKTAFLQGKCFDRDVYLVPPPEAGIKEGFLWKLNTCVYGLNDASREWYLTVKQELLKLGATVSKYDQAVFTFHKENKLEGIISTHVDDFCWGGSSIFIDKVIVKLRQSFMVKTEEQFCFKYLGLKLLQSNSMITVSQDDFVKTLRIISCDSAYDHDTQISCEQLTQCRSSIGKLNWLATQTRPDLSYEVCNLTSTLKERKVESILQVNKSVRKAKKISSKLIVPNLDDLQKLKIVAYRDASFGALTDGGSQGGYVVFLVGQNKNYVPLAWQSRKLKRVVKSSQAAETLAMVDTLEACVYYRKFLLELLCLVDEPDKIPIIGKTDNAGLYDSSYSDTQILDKRLRIEMAIIREMLECKVVQDMEWVPTSHQIADTLTKRGSSSCKVLDHIGDPRKPLH